MQLLRSLVTERCRNRVRMPVAGHPRYMRDACGGSTNLRKLCPECLVAPARSGLKRRGDETSSVSLDFHSQFGLGHAMDQMEYIEGEIAGAVPDNYYFVTSK